MKLEKIQIFPINYYLAVIFGTMHFGTSQQQCIPQYITSTLFQNQSRKRESTCNQ